MYEAEHKKLTPTRVGCTNQKPRACRLDASSRPKTGSRRSQVRKLLGRAARGPDRLRLRLVGPRRHLRHLPPGWGLRNGQARTCGQTHTHTHTHTHARAAAALFPFFPAICAKMCVRTCALSNFVSYTVAQNRQRRWGFRLPLLCVLRLEENRGKPRGNLGDQTLTSRDTRVKRTPADQSRAPV